MARESMRSMFGNLKSRITGRRRNEQEEYYDDAEYDDYEEDYEEDYSSYDDYEERDARQDSHRSDRLYEDDSQRFAAEMDARYSKAVTTRPSRSYHSPRLVSIDDVRANTQVYNGSERSSERMTIESDYRSSDERRAATRAASSVTPVGTAASSIATPSGLDSLFASTSAESDSWSSDSFGSSVTRRFGSTRSLEVVRPLTYAEAERVAKGLKAGDAVVLSLKSTPDALAARLVDFAFGVACALDATVERLCPKVYAITAGADLTEVERSTLKSQGVI